MTEQRTDQRHETQQADGLDWAIISLSIAGIMVVSGIGALAWMMAHRDYWATDPALPAGFAAFSKMITLATLGALAIILGLVVAVAALVCWVVNQRHKRLRASMEEMIEALVIRVEIDHVRREHAIKEVLEELVDRIAALAAMQAEQQNLLKGLSEQRGPLLAEQEKLREEVLKVGSAVAGLGRWAQERMAELSEEHVSLEEQVRQCMANIRPPHRRQRNRRPREAGQRNGKAPDLASDFTKYLAAREDLKREHGDGHDGSD